MKNCKELSVRLQFSVVSILCCLFLTHCHSKQSPPATPELQIPDMLLELLHLFIDDHRLTIDWKSSDATLPFGSISIDKQKRELHLRNPSLEIHQDSDGSFLISGTKTVRSASFKFFQTPAGKASLTIAIDTGTQTYTAENFSELIHKNTEKVQVMLLRPLAELRITVALHPDLPVVMATATTGFSAPTPEVAAAADSLIKQLRSSNVDEVAKATRELTKLFPHAVHYITEAAERVENSDVKQLLQKVIAAHPGIARARSFVIERKLHEDRAYLKAILDDVPFFSADARARLSILDR